VARGSLRISAASRLENPRCRSRCRAFSQRSRS
jgi:hypothetical protein